MNDFDERLRRRLRALDASVPTAAARGRVGGKATPQLGRGGRVAGKLPIGLAACLIVVIVGAAIVGVNLQRGPSFGSVASSAPPTASMPQSVSPSAPATSDGLPIQIDGKRVYRVSEQAEWENLGGSFLLVAIPTITNWVGCPFGGGSGTPSERDLVGDGCAGPLWLVNATGQDTNTAWAAPKSPVIAVLGDWLDHAVVLRVHTHDNEAAQCGPETRARCEAAVVVEALIWPVVPTEIAGEHVYRSSEQESFASLKGSFLLGGLVTWPDYLPACPSVAGPPGDGQGLVPYCYGPSIDGLELSPKSKFNQAALEIVVARVHVNDPLAAKCQPATLADCKAAIVVESVVWSSNPYQASPPTPTPAAPTPSTSPASTP